MKKKKLKKRQKRRACQRKQKYDTQGAAYIEAGKHVGGHRSVQVYQCKICGGWHLTHRNKKGRQIRVSNAFRKAGF